MAKQVELKVNDQTIRLNPFVQKTLAGVVEGYLDALDEIPIPVRRIEIVIAEDNS